MSEYVCACVWLIFSVRVPVVTLHTKIMIDNSERKGNSLSDRKCVNLLKVSHITIERSAYKRRSTEKEAERGNYRKRTATKSKYN